MKDITVKRLEKWPGYKYGCYMATYDPRPYVLRLGVSKANSIARLERHIDRECLRSFYYTKK